MHSIQILTVSIVLMSFVGNTQSCVSQGPPLNDPIDDRCKGWTFKDEDTKSCFKVFNGRGDIRNWFDAMSKCQQFQGSNAFLATLPSLPAATLEKVTAGSVNKLWAGGICGSPALSGRNMCFSYVPGADVCGILDNCMAEYSYVCQAYYDVAGPDMSDQALPANCYAHYINSCF